MSEDNQTLLQWRPMRAADLSAVDDLARRIHPDFPERLEVLAEKFHLFSRGCFMLDANDVQPRGYCLSHPWTIGPPPALDTLLAALPARPDAHFIHDVAVEASLQRRNVASALVPKLVEIARAIPVARMTLVAVGGSAPFWTRMGFQRTADENLQDAARAKYGAGAVQMERVLNRAAANSGPSS